LTDVKTLDRVRLAVLSDLQQKHRQSRGERGPGSIVFDRVYAIEPPLSLAIPTILDLAVVGGSGGVMPRGKDSAEF
jgi:hypothetical protein